MKINDIMATSVVTVSEEATAKDAAKMMKEYNIGAVPVIGENSALVGIITDRDIVVRNVARDENPQKVKNLMTTDVKSVTPDTDIYDAAKMMADYQVRRVPVVKDGALVGMASIGDIAVTGDYKTEVSSALSEISEGCSCSMCKNKDDDDYEDYNVN